MPSVIVIGGGAVGCSALYHLTQLGVTDAVLLERDELTAGSTWHAAGNCPNFSTSWNVIKLQRHSTRLYAELGARVGYDINYHVTGSVRLAHTRDRVDEFRHVVSQARAQGLELQMLSPAEVQARHPFVTTDDIRAGLYDPYDGDIDPAQLTQALAKGARDAGAQIYRNTRVTAIERAAVGRVARAHEPRRDPGGVRHQRGGLPRRRGRRDGRRVPADRDALAPVPDYRGHPGPRRARRMSGCRCCAIPDVSYYMRQERQGLILGPYEWQATAHWLDRIPDEFAHQLFDDDLGRLEKYIEAACERVPILGTAGVKKVINGPIPYAPDGNPLIGPAPGLPGFFHCCAFTFGIAQAGGAGKIIAEWVVNGQPEWDVWPLDSRRYLEYRQPQVRAREGHRDLPARIRRRLSRPRSAPPDGRPNARRPICGLRRRAHASARAAAGSAPSIFRARTTRRSRRVFVPHARPGTPRSHANAPRRTSAWPCSTCRASRNSRSPGPGARAWLDHMVAGTVPRPVARR